MVSLTDLLPHPFSWVHVPSGLVTIESGGWLNREHDTTIAVTDFNISKYPITNAQFKVFFDTGGYHQAQWWGGQAWMDCVRKNWPRTLAQTAGKAGPDHPVVRISWYEAVTFCRWLSALTGDEIGLPSEEQWQRAAQGDDGRRYPWGSKWDCTRCNNAVPPCDAAETTPVYFYEGKGDSPYGVVDMSGNVFEWCSTTYEMTRPESGELMQIRLQKGGYYGDDRPRVYSCTECFGGSPDFAYDNLGFRVVCVDKSPLPNL